jgi:hypothetical protein
MSTFLSRVAARAVGAQASATPRPAARYEPVPGSELVERAEDRLASDRTPTERGGRGPGPAPPEPSPRAPASSGTHETHARQIHLPAAKAGLARVESSHQETQVGAERIETVAQSSPNPPRAGARPADTPPTPPTPWTPAAPTAPPAPATPNPASHPHQLPPTPPPAERGPDVRVHIGRLEVRANLQQAPPPPRRREPEPAPELSLTDYLHGSKRA